MSTVDEKVTAFRKNVKYFAKCRGDNKVGSVERYAGVNNGYLSRASATSIPLKTALKMSEYLGVGLDELTNPNARFDEAARLAAEKLEEVERKKLRSAK